MRLLRVSDVYKGIMTTKKAEQSRLYAGDYAYAGLKPDRKKAARRKRSGNETKLATPKRQKLEKELAWLWVLHFVEGSPRLAPARQTT